MKKIIPISCPSITKKEIAYVTDAVKSGWVSSLGYYIDKFETRFAAFCGVKYALAVSNGTVGLHLVLKSLDIGPGDEVIVPDLTFVATANAVIHVGAKVVFVDIDRETLCIDPGKIGKAITSRTRAILPVHLYGHPANITEINKIAAKHSLYVIEDAAEAHGAEINGKKVGSLATCGVFSFYGNKIITTGEGGIITTNNRKLYERAKVLRDHAMSKEKRYWHTEVGYNYRMTNLQAALGLAQLERIQGILIKKRRIFEHYQKELGNIPGFKLNRTAPWAKNVYWMICLEIENLDEAKRATMMCELKKVGIDSRPYFYPISDMPMYKSAKTPVSHDVYKKGLNLPSYFDLKAEQIQYICDMITSIRRA